MAEAVAHELVMSDDFQAAVDAADIQIKELLKDKPSMEPARHIRDHGVDEPFARLRLTTDETGNQVLETFGQRDTAVIAFIPDDNGKFTRGSIRPIYFNPKSLNALNSLIGSESFSSEGRASLITPRPNIFAKRHFVVKNPIKTVLPSGSFVVAASDGGMESLAEPAVLAATGVLQDRKRAMAAAFTVESEASEFLESGLTPFMEILNGPTPLFHLKKLLRAIQTTDRLDDDATVVTVFVKSEESRVAAKLKIPEFSEETYPLLMELIGTAESLPLDTDELLEKYGRETAILLIRELIEQGYTEFPRDYIFANACALVRIDWLPEEMRQWFKRRGLTVVDNENIRVHLRHEKETQCGLGGCHEVGNLLLFGEPGVKAIHIDTEKEPPRYVASVSFRKHEVNERFLRGAWADVNVWERLRFTVCGGYVSGTGPNARGILVPAGEIPIVYINTENSFTEGLPERNFYIRQGDINQYAAYGLYALGKYLKGEIPALSREEIQSNEGK